MIAGRKCYQTSNEPVILERVKTSKKKTIVKVPKDEAAGQNAVSVERVPGNSTVISVTRAFGEHGNLDRPVMALKFVVGPSAPNQIKPVPENRSKRYKVKWELAAISVDEYQVLPPPAFQT